MDEENTKLFAPKEIIPPLLDTASLTIKIANSCKRKTQAQDSSLSQRLLSNSLSSSPYNSPSLISPASSAFVSALQSPYISPRATNLPSSEDPTPATTLTHPSPPRSYSGSQSDDIPSTSYTPPPERCDFGNSQNATNNNAKPKIVTCVPATDNSNNAPRVSFSFPVPRISFAKTSVSPASASSNVKLRNCDVYIGFHGQNPNLIRFCKWLKSELELQGIACFVADRASYAENQSHEIADRVICSVTFGVVVLTRHSLLNHMSLEEIRFFAQKKNLIPLLFDIDIDEAVAVFNRNADNKECKQALDALMKSHEFTLEGCEGNWRSCVSNAAGILRAKLGRKSVVENGTMEGFVFEDLLPFSRNRCFVGREKEVAEIESVFFGFGDYFEDNGGLVSTIKGGSTTPGQQSDGLADDESEFDGNKLGRYINLEVGNCKEPNLESWVEPVIGRNSVKRASSKYKKSRSGKYYKSCGNSIVCISGSPGVGKTELALEFAYRYSQRYKMVFWIGGEARHFRQNILNISANLGLDVSADPEKERGRIRSFDEQETEAFKRVKRELFRDMPYLIIIDNLETEKEWWEGKDLHDLIPSNTGGSHVIITTRLSRVMNFDLMQLQQLPLSDAMVLIRGRKKEEFSADEVEYLGKFDEKLRRSSFGLSIVGSLLSELSILPSALFEAVNQIHLGEATAANFSIADQQFCRTNPFLMKLLEFCAIFLQQSNLLALRMLQVGAWFAAAPISASLLSSAANNMPPVSQNRLKKWSTCLKLTFGCCSSGCCLANQGWANEEEESALVLVRLGLARRVTYRQPGCGIQFHPITQMFAKRSKDAILAAKATVQGVRKSGFDDALLLSSLLDHFWACAFVVFGFKSEPPLIQLKAMDMVLFIKRTALPLALKAFTTFSMCNSALELLKVCTNVLEEAEKSFVSQIQDWCNQGSLCWKKKLQKGNNQRVDEYVWKEVTLLKATLLETRSKLLIRGGEFDCGEDLCRTCISIRTVMLGHNHAQTLAAQKTLAKLVRMRSKI
ncbi:OLC1v1022350C1 [Oldenlandia corymbosa var. corymbosa]|uniref:OLC1v1022350C1 n=1 Tax=Oldenlandia corymbosa var. corymbosa TaxID=529605 RepID=A0AAV1BXN5_OLDCO|nr:OLC1v1022350C1 [Oldenlandia corymbosa var. corymbosa]